MIQSDIKNIETLVSEISSSITNERIKELFTTKPKIEIDVYKKTAYFSALKAYEEQTDIEPAIPHAFYAILEHDLEIIGLIKTYKKYEKQINLILSLMKMDKNYFLEILKILKEPNNVNSALQLEKRQELKEIIRKSTAKYKENFVKQIVEEKLILLRKQTKKNPKQEQEHIINLNIFERLIMFNKDIKESIKTVILEKTGKKVSDYQLQSIIYETLSKDYETKYKEILNIEEPPKYNIYLSNRSLNRLRQNQGPQINKLLKDEDNTIKALVLEIIQLKIELQSQNNNPNNNEYIIRHNLEQKLQKLHESTTKNTASVIETIIGIMKNTDVVIYLNNGKFEFKLNQPITEEEKIHCKQYEENLKNIKSIHNMLFRMYTQQNKTFFPLVKTSKIPLAINEDQYEIDTSYWLTKEKIIAAVEKIDNKKIDLMTDTNFALLKKFLIQDGLLWAYIAENIDLNTFCKIINNFEAIAAITPKEDISISKLHEIIKKANINNYTNEIIIGLVGQEIATKVINYNQFAGVTVTDELINKRLRKLIDLSVRSEYATSSSLPFNCDVKLDGYHLQRYRNNDPEIFTSGVDTKTCFFISVNENDFFFYSLLNKNGFVIKIVNDKNELIARASCFRKNNVFMINGIRCKNNKVHPDSREESEEIKKIVKMIELFAQKLIERTSHDECPIDYVVCNKAGILENSFFENKYEQINNELFNEPVNIYDEDWEEFVHLYDGKEQMLQEVPHSPNKSFTTDFGNHFPTLLIYSRDYRPLLSPKDIAYNDQPATYERPKKEIEAYINLEITDEILARINRIKALSCFIGTEEEQLKKQTEFKLLKKSDIESIELGDDWYALLKTDKTFEVVRAKNETREIKNVAIMKKN